MSVGDYTIGDLLAEPELGLELATSDSAALSHPVRGAHSIEVENPAAWIEPGWMMLTMGVRLRNRPAQQRQLVADLKQLGASCLAFGVGLAFKAVPPALLQEAERVGLPVITVPEGTNFGDVTQAVFESTVSIDSATFRRLSSIQQNLIRAFGDDRPLESIVRRLGRLVNAVAAVVTREGDTTVTTGSLPLTEILPAVVMDYTGVIRPQEIEGWHVLSAPINDMQGGDAPWLIVASQRTTVTDDLARAAMQVTLPLLGALLRMSDTSRNQDRAIRGALLDAILDGPADEIERRMLTDRVAAFGLCFGDGLHVWAFRDPYAVDQEKFLSLLGRRLAEALERRSTKYLLSVRPTEVVLVAERSEGSTAVIESIARDNPDVRIGRGRPAENVSEIDSAWLDAQTAVRHMLIEGRRGMLSFDDLDLVTQILAEVPVERLGPKIGTMTRMLSDQPIQLEALRAYFAHSRDIKAAAAAMYVHPNTLRYRLERFEQALGSSLQEPATIASVYCLLALMPDEVIA